MDDFLRDKSMMESWPSLPGKGKVATATRAAKVMLGSDDVIETMRVVYCDLPISGVCRPVASMLVNMIDSELRTRGR